MPHLPPPSPRRNSSKTTKVQKILSDDAFRQSIEVSWKRSVLPEAESLEVLARCKALNEFIKKGLLAEVDDDTCTAAVSQGRNKGSNRAAKQKVSTAAPSTRQGSQPRAENTAPAPLASRITAKESEALLGLLLLEDNAAATGASQGMSASTTSSSSGGSDGGSSQCSGSTKCDNGSSRRGALVQDNSPTSTTQGEPRASPSPDQQRCSQGVGVDAVDDWVIGLLNTSDDVPTPGDATHLSSYCPCSQDELKQQLQQVHVNSNTASTGQPALQQQQQQQQQEAEGVPPVMPQAACREAHRQALVKPPHQQQQELRAAATKHESINAAWQGFYSYWGPHAACTIQQHWRAYRARRHFHQVRGAAVVLQAFSRGHLLRVSRDNALRLHREQQQQQLQLLLQQQALELQQQQQQQEQQGMQELLQEQAKAAAVALQSAVRGWLARRFRDRCAELAAQGTAADASVDIADWAVQDPTISMPPSVCSRGSDSSCSRGSSRESHSRGSTVSSMDVHTVAAAGEATAYGAGSLQAADKQPVGQQQWHPLDAAVQEGTSSSSADEAQYALPGLVIRNAAETRTASHKAAAQMGHDCQEDLARQLLQRSEQLGTAEGCKAADLGARTVMASSSSRQLHAAMHAVKTARPTI